jgi:hypothetical protein
LFIFDVLDILVEMIAKLKSKEGVTIAENTPQSKTLSVNPHLIFKLSRNTLLKVNQENVDIGHTASNMDEIPARERERVVIPQLTTDKAKAFEIFKGGYPSGNWIDNQKGILKDKYLQAKNLGEAANNLRIRIRTRY